MTTDLLASIHSALPEIIEECKKLSYLATNNDGSTSPFDLLAVMDPAEALNKCAFTSRVIARDADFSFLGEDTVATFTGIQSPAGNHYGVLLSHAGDTDGGVILDFTARQFDANATFPLVMDCWKWQLWTESHLGRVGNWYHTYTW